MTTSLIKNDNHRCSTRLLAEKLKKTDQSPSFYRQFPALFLPYFSINKKSHKTIHDLSEAGYLYYLSLLQMDQLIDEGNLRVVPLMINLQEQAVKSLTNLFGADSDFWIYWDSRKKDYFEAIKIERSLKEEKTVSIDSYKELADKKVAFSKIAVDALFIISGRVNYSIYKKLLESQKLFSFGYQLFDDVKYFKRDFEKKQFNLAVYCLKKEIDFKTHDHNVDVLQKLLYISGRAEEVLKISIAIFQQALDILEPLEVESKWQSVVIELKQKVEKYMDFTIGYIKSIQTRISLNSVQSKQWTFFDYSSVSNQTIVKGLNYLKYDCKRDFAELKHIMYLGDIHGFNNNQQIHVSDIFQRAILSDSIISVAKTNKLSISDFLEHECKYLIERRNRDDIGGWAYFPTVNEIAADIDDLGQIIQLFKLARKEHFIKKYCSKAIRVAIDERTHSNGGIQTWIISNDNKSKIQKKQELFNETKCGKGPDLEVVANFIYALLIFDKKAFSSYIDNSIDYIIKNQSDKGSWLSRWYYGYAYGTYMALRLLSFQQSSDCSDSIDKALRFIKACQQADGGFGLSEKHKSDPLSTSYCLLALKLFLCHEAIWVKQCISKAENYLMDTQSPEGSWKDVPFIIPRLNEPYRSKTLTTAIALKTLC